MARIDHGFYSLEERIFYVLLLLGGGVTAAGLYAAHSMETHGHAITGMTNQVVWGLPHVFAIFLIVAASGVLNVASIGSVTEPGYTDQLMKAAVEAFGQLDILVNNAGLSRDRMCHQMTDEMWDLVIDVNLTGTFNCIRSCAPYLREVAKREIEERGQPRYHRKIVNFFSTAAIRGNPGQINYVAAKMGNVGITRVVAQEWARFGINVNAVAPGFTETRMTAAKKPGDVLGVPEEQRQSTLQRIPMARFGLPQDIANAVLFFSSPLSDYITGQAINVSGGMQIP